MSKKIHVASNCECATFQKEDKLDNKQHQDISRDMFEVAPEIGTVCCGVHAVGMADSGLTSGFTGAGRSDAFVANQVFAPFILHSLVICGGKAGSINLIRRIVAYQINIVILLLQNIT